MSSFLFLTFCVYVFCCLGLHFSAVPVPNSFLRQLFTCAAQTSTGAPHSFNRAYLGFRWCRFPTPPSNRPRIVAQGRVLFSPQNELTPPPKGGGAGFCSSLGFRVLLGSCLWQPLATTGSHASNGAGNPSRWCRFPTLSPKPHKGPHRAEFWFSHQNELTPPPLGGGARYRLFGLLVFSRREARCFSAGKDGYFVSEGFSWQLPWQLLLTTGSHGSNGVGLGLWWCRSPTRPQNRTQGRTGPS